MTQCANVYDVIYCKKKSVTLKIVCNKKKIQFFVMNMPFISSREARKCIFHSWLRHSWNMHFFASLDEINGIFIPKNWISSIYYMFLQDTDKSVFHYVWLVLSSILSCLCQSTNLSPEKYLGLQWYDQIHSGSYCLSDHIGSKWKF